MKGIIETVGLCKAFNKQRVLKDVSITVKEGEILALIGPSGVGKTTLLRLLDLLDRPSSGEIYYRSKEVSKAPNGLRLEIQRRMGLVFQKPVVFNTSVYNNVAYGLKIRGLSKEVIHQKVTWANSLVRISGLTESRALSLSGGEQQRVALARTLVTTPDILLLDEPTANLDPSNIKIIEDVVKEINKEQRTTTIIATHNMYQAKRLADRVAFMLNGQLVEVDTVEKIFNNPKNEETLAFIRGEMVF